MKMLALAMTSLVATAAAMLVLAVADDSAVAHTSYCGHGTKTFWLDTPQGLTEHREVYRWATGVGSRHLHGYRVYRRSPTGTWTYIHAHERLCADTHPV